MGFLFQIDQPDYFVFIRVRVMISSFCPFSGQNETYCGVKQIRRHFGGLGM